MGSIGREERVGCIFTCIYLCDAYIYRLYTSERLSHVVSKMGGGCKRL